MTPALAQKPSRWPRCKPPSTGYSRATRCWCAAERIEKRSPSRAAELPSNRPDPGLPQNHNQRIFTASDGKQYDYLCGLNCSVPGTQTGGPRLIFAEAKDRWAQNVRVGCFSPNYQTFFKGLIAEILVYDRALTREERFRVTAYLMRKWDL